VTARPLLSNAVSLALLRFVPEGLSRKLHSRRGTFTAADVPAPIEAPSGSIRLLIAPANFAGQGFAWARAVEQISEVGAASMQYLPRKDFSFETDYGVPVNVYAGSRGWQNRQWKAVTQGFTHVLIEAERPIFGRKFDTFRPANPVRREVVALRKAGLKVGFISHGTDLRPPSQHRAKVADSPFLPELVPHTAGLETKARENAELLAECGGDVFVSTSDLLDYAPGASWLPVVVKPALWTGGAPVLERKRPIVVHAPTQSALKGTDLIEAAVEKLHDEGLIEYQRIVGVPHADMPEIIRSADIVLEQFRLGMYAAAGIEAMAAGRVTVGYVHESMRTYLRENFNAELPIVQSRGQDIEATLRDIVTRRSHFAEFAAGGPEFVRRFHDGTFSAQALRNFLTT
jgi:hypothetical protein